MKKSCTFNYEESTKKLQQLWVEYNELIPTYHKLISIKKELGIKRNAIKKSFIEEEFPWIEFLELSSLDEAIEYVYDLNPQEISDLIQRIEFEKKYGSFYSVMKNWIKQSILEIRRYGKPAGFHYDTAKARDRNKQALKLLSCIEEIEV